MSNAQLELYLEDTVAERNLWIDRREKLVMRKRKYLGYLNDKLNECDRLLETVGGVLDIMDDFSDQGEYDILEGEYGAYDRTTNVFIPFRTAHRRYEHLRDKKKEFQLKIYEYDKEIGMKLQECTDSIKALAAKIATIREFLMDETPCPCLSESQVPF